MKGPSLRAMRGTRGSLLHDSNTPATLTFFISADSVSTYTAFTNQRQYDTGISLVLIPVNEEMNSLAFRPFLHLLIVTLTKTLMSLF